MMLVDNPLPPYAAPYDLSDFFHTDFLSSPAPSSSVTTTKSLPPSSSTTSANAESSTPSSPESSHSPASALNTPPQPQSLSAFPDILDPSPFVTQPYNAASSSTSGNPGDGGVFSFIDEELSLSKAPVGAADSSSSFDLYSSYALGMSMPMDYNAMEMDLNALGMDMDLTVPIDSASVATTSNNSSAGSQVSSQAQGTTSPESGIDPQLVGTPAPLNHDGDDEQDSEDHNGDEGGVDEENMMEDDEDLDSDRPSKKKARSSRKSSSTRSNTSGKGKQQSQPTQQQLPRVTLTITPVKVGGHGKARRGTVQSGGVVKKSAGASTSSSLLVSAFSTPAPRPQSVEKENSSLPNSNSIAVARTSSPAVASSSSTATTSTSGKAKRSASGKEKSAGKARNDDRGERQLTLPEKLAQLKSSSTPVVARNLGLSDWVSGGVGANISGADSPAEQVDHLYAFSNAQSASPSSMNGNMDDDDKDDDIPADWRPPPEVFQKMSSKEKRQLRNKISARNFRVRRKEYISTLEGDIAERDRLLQAIRAQLGETQNENVALRQEIDALKKALIVGRGSGGESGTESVMLNLPPPAPLPAQSAAEKLAAAASSPVPTSSSLLTPNTQKDLPTSPRVGGKRGGFWGGVSSFGSGVTPVHATIIPEWGSILGQGVFGTNGHSSDSSSASSSPGPSSDYSSDEEPVVHIRDHQELENINPRLNGGVRDPQDETYPVGAGNGFGVSALGTGGLDGFADMNPFTMKTLDTYRMHLWGRMAAQYHQHQHNVYQQSKENNTSNTKPLSGLAGSLRPAFFSPSTKANTTSSSGPPPPYTPYAAGTIGAGPLSALLMGKSASCLKSPLYSSAGKKDVKEEPVEATIQQYAQFQRDRESQQREAVVAAIATQTLLKRLGSAFWDAFSGHSSPTTSSSPSLSSAGPPRPFAAKWDVEKVRKVLEGKAVLKVVDVDPTPQVVQREAPKEVKREVKDRCGGPAAECLSQMLGGLTLG